MFKIIKANFIANKSVLIWMTTLFFMIFYVSFFFEEFVLPNLFYSFLIVNTLLQTEDRYSIDKLYCSFPIKRSTIVFSRYLSVLYALFITLILSQIMSILLVNKTDIQNMDYWFFLKPIIPLEQTLYFVIPIVIFFSLVLPFYFVFGYLKGTIIGVISFLITSVLLSWIFNCFFHVDDLYYLKLKLPFLINLVVIALIKVKNYFGLQSFILGTCIFTFIILILSMSISIKLYQAKTMNI